MLRTELTGKQHTNVLADIRSMLEALGLMSADTSARILVPGPNGGARTAPAFNLPKDLTITLISGYSVVMRHRIVTRWQELEAQQQAPALPNFGNPAEAARAWALRKRPAGQSPGNPLMRKG